MDLLKAYIKIHEKLLISDGKGGLQFPAHFVLVIHECLNDLWFTKSQVREDGSVKEAWEVNDEKIEFFRNVVCPPPGDVALMHLHLRRNGQKMKDRRVVRHLGGS